MQEVNGPAISGAIYDVPEGMPLSVFTDRYSRSDGNGGFQSYEQRIREVVYGNFTLEPQGSNGIYERDETEATRRSRSGEGIGPSVVGQDYDRTLELALKGAMPFSGRHLQHGDKNQASQNMEIFTNCSTACFSFMEFLLLLNGSGVGRDYSAESCRVDWEFMPNVRVVLNGGEGDDGKVDSGAHADFNSAREEFSSVFESLRDARHKYDSDSEDVRWFTVKDSREGWAEVIAILETATFFRNHKNSMFIFDFSEVRCSGSPIAGMQYRPAQGPVPLMRSLCKISSIKGAKMRPWKQALFIDHYLAVCVVMGNVRRAARMATKFWKDRDVIEFIDIKRGGFLWSANNSITVDAEFWEQARNPRPSHARRVFEAAVGAAYFDKTGEPGFINVDKLNDNRDGFDDITASNYIRTNGKLTLHPKTIEMIDNILTKLKKKKYPFITNPCGEIVLSVFGGYCVIGDVCLAKCDTLDEARDAVRLMAPFLVRVNRMKSLYDSEVKRTNRIGIGITGIHEFAWQLFGCDFWDLIGSPIRYGNNPIRHHLRKARKFWDFVEELQAIAMKSAEEFSLACGMVVPHTGLTIKPSGTISKVMYCTEGAHLPSVLYYIRWVSFPKDSGKAQIYADLGYPVKDVSHQYHNTLVVGFPTKQPLVDLMAGNKTATSDAISPKEHYEWLRLLEKHWLGGDQVNNQISYTLKYDPDKVSFTQFMDVILEYQPQVKCCSVMPIVDSSAYSYLPEEEIDKDRYDELLKGIRSSMFEDYDESSIECEGGACPIEKNLNGEMRASSASM